MSTISITKQDACFVDTRIEQGTAVQLHYVVRTTPFALHIASSGKRDFNKGALDCQLLLDQEDRAPVPKNPMSFLARPSQDGRTCVVECRILELSSHAATKTFIIKVVHLDEAGKRAEVVSKPIVAVAKQQQIRNRMNEVNKSLTRDTEDHSQRVAKRPRSEDVLHMLQKIAETQARHEQLLVERAPAHAQAELTLEAALDAFCRAYHAEDAEERPHKLRRLVESRSVADREALQTLGSVFSASPAVATPEGDEAGSSDSDIGLNFPGDSHYAHDSASAQLLGINKYNVSRKSPRSEPVFGEDEYEGSPFTEGDFSSFMQVEDVQY